MAEITVTIPNSTFTITEVSSGIEVTTPTNVIVDVSSDSNTIDITSTPAEINITEVGVTNTDQLIEGTTNLFYTDARWDARLATKTTDNLNEGSTSLYFTTARARQSIQVVDTGGDGSLSYDNSTGNITYTGPSAAEVRAHFSAGTGIQINAGVISVTGEQPVIGLTTSSTSANQVLDSFGVAEYRTAKYIVSVSSGAEYHSFEIMLNHNGTVANQTTYADLPTGTSLATFAADISGGSVRLLTTPANAVTVYKVTRTAIAV